LARRRPVLLGAVAAALLFGGCFEGTVRDPPARTGDAREVPPPGRADRVLTIAAVGDTAMGATPELPADPATYLDPVAGELRGDVVFGNLEGTLTDVSEDVKCEGAEPGTCFAFRAPPEYADHLAAAGFTVMSLANNHSYDFGEAGQAETIAALRGAGIDPAGLNGKATYVRVAGARVAFLGFAPYDYTNSLTDLETARALIGAARRRADVVVVAIHAGAEGSDATHVTGGEETYLGEDRGNAEEFAHLAVRAGADLVLGSGPHVLRGIEIYRGRLIAYSLGNFSGFHNFSGEGVLGESVVLHLTLAAADGAFRAGRLGSVRMVDAGRPVPDPEGAGAALVARLSREDLGGRAVDVDADGRIER
jgi:hypothetical protein